MIAEGAAQCYPRFAPTMEWDTAAGHALVSECGGEIFDVDLGQPLRYNKEELTNPSFVAQPAGEWRTGNP
jgi:3'(2'), 5'-bisphosphate nucleotidase